MKTVLLSKASANSPMVLAFLIGILALSGCTATQTKRELKLGTYNVTIEPARQFQQPTRSQKECIIPSDLEGTKNFPGPVPRTVLMCAIRNYHIEGDHVTYEQLCKDDKQTFGQDLVIKWDMILKENGYEGSMKTTFPGSNEELETQIRASYIGEGCQY